MFFLFTVYGALNKNMHGDRMVGVATTAGAKALPDPPGVSEVQGHERIPKKHPVLKWHNTLKKRQNYP